MVDLGCGTGRDAFVIAQLVGESGRVIGVDMTDAQLALARETEAWHAERFGFAAPNTDFRLGFIEDLAGVGLESESVDVIVSNCVVNLSPRKDVVMAEAARVLRQGGEFYLSDVLCDRRLPDAVARDPILHAECLGGAMYTTDFITLAKSAGFLDPRVVKRAPIEITNDAVRAKVGEARFESITYRLLRLPGLDADCEDYGQIATYRGGVVGAESAFWLDDHHAFEVGRPERVCRNTARMLAESRFASAFDVTPAAETHFGAFPCVPTLAAQRHMDAAGQPPGACC